MGGGVESSTEPFHPQRRKAALVLLSVTLIWGATFIWMKQALNALEIELSTYGNFPVVAFLVAVRFSIAIPPCDAVFSNRPVRFAIACGVERGGAPWLLDAGWLCGADGGPQRHQSLHLCLPDIALRRDDGRADRGHDRQHTSSVAVLGGIDGHRRCWIHRGPTASFVGLG